MALFGKRRKQQEEASVVAAPIVGPEDDWTEVSAGDRTVALPPIDAAGFRSAEAHRDFVLSLVDELPPFGQQLLDALDLTLCEDVVSEVDLPGFDNSAMDGYAVQWADLTGASDLDPVVLAVVGEIAAGQLARAPLSPGTAMKVMTGAPIPDGADCVVPYEDTDRGVDDVLVYREAVEGQHIRRRGEDLAAGSRVFRAGEQLHPASIGLLAAIGLDKALVRPRPRVVVIATGSELVEPGMALRAPGQIYDSNSFLLAAAARRAGAQVFRVGLVSDDPEQVKQLIRDQLVRADLVVTSGGVSQGDYDVVKQVMPELGWCDFSQVAMQPGKPQGFGLIGEDQTPMIMVPGNPVSAFVSFEAFVRPVIRKLRGLQPYTRVALPAVAAHDMPSATGKRQFARGIVTGGDEERRVQLVGGHGSHLIGDLAQANCLVILDEETDFVAAGDTVPVWLLTED